eukprot:1329349-Pleurochrysis_carterae.AAC.2
MAFSRSLFSQNGRHSRMLAQPTPCCLLPHSYLHARAGTAEQCRSITNLEVGCPASCARRSRSCACKFALRQVQVWVEMHGAVGRGEPHGASFGSRLL